jgi:hypothetical protein
MPTSKINNNHMQCKLFLFVLVSPHTVFWTNWTCVMMMMMMILSTYKCAWCHNPENNNLNNHSHEIWKSVSTVTPTTVPTDFTFQIWPSYQDIITYKTIKPTGLKPTIIKYNM